MIVVVMLGLLAGIAVPIFVKIRDGGKRTALVNDARQLGGAAQQYMLEHATVEVALLIEPTMGRVSGALGEYVREVGRGYSHSAQIQADYTFTLAHSQVRGGEDGKGARGAVVVFNSDGVLYR